MNRELAMNRSDERWYRALPPNFVVMLVAVALAGGMAGRANARMLWATPLMLTTLLVGAGHQRRRQSGVATEPSLPAAARDALDRSLALLPAGQPRDLLLELGRVAEHTYASLPEGFRTGALGRSVVELVIEAGPLGLETMRLTAIANELTDNGAADQSRAACDLLAATAARVLLLKQALTLLGRIAAEGAGSNEGAATEVTRLIEQLRTEQHWRVEGEAGVRDLLRRNYTVS